MTDLRFNDVVDSTRMIGKKGKYATSTCKTCSEQYKVTREAFERDNLWNLDGSKYLPASVDQDVMLYVAKMRAWNCCHEGEEPLDGLPEEPEISGVNFK